MMQARLEPGARFGATCAAGDREVARAVVTSVDGHLYAVPLEAMKQGTPVIVSRQSGVSEDLRHALEQLSQLSTTAGGHATSALAVAAREDEPKPDAGAA